MASMNRRMLQFIIDSLGRTKQIATRGYGSADYVDGVLLRLEAALCRLRIATLFHDKDYAKNFVKFGSNDNVGLGIQGATIRQSTAPSLAFPVYNPPVVDPYPWNPSFHGAPCPEGWYVHEYNAWKGFPLAPATTGIRAARLLYPFPVRWTGSSYARVSYWRHARFISLLNNTSGNINQASFVLNKNDVAGVCAFSYENAPIDINFNSDSALFQSYDTAWQEISLPEYNKPLQNIAYSIVPNTESTYKVTLSLPDGFIWPADKYWHVVMYWGSKDNFTWQQRSLLTGNTDSVLTPVIVWPKKNYFISIVRDRIDWHSEGVFDNNPYLIAHHKNHFTFIDGGYSNPSVPIRYRLPPQWPEADTNGIYGTLAGYVQDIKKGSVVSATIAVYPQGESDDIADVQARLFLGPEITPEFFPSNWKDCTYFPDCPEGWVPLINIVFARASDDAYDIAETVSANNSGTDFGSPYTYGSNNINYHIDICWSQLLLPTYARKPMGDPVLARTILGKLRNNLIRIRNLNLSEPAAQIAYRVLLDEVGVPKNLAPNKAYLVNPDNFPSKIVRGLLKNPVNPLLADHNEDEPTAIQFTVAGQEIIFDVCGATPSTELARLSANRLEVKDVKLFNPSVLEIFQAPSAACSTANISSAGGRIGQDYTFRLVMVDNEQNKLVKNIYVMASKFLLSDEEFARQSKMGSTTGYFTKSMLQEIDEWRLNGYAGLIPDLAMGESRDILTRVVSPSDETKITEEQFRKNLQNQGLSQKQIDEAVLVYLEDGGEFYTINLNQYSNKFTAIESMGVAVSKYAFRSSPYWTINLNSYFEFSGSPHTELPDLKGDSFTIAPQGLPAGSLEQWGSQITADVFNRVNASGDAIPITTTKIATSFSFNNSSSCVAIGIRLSIDIALDNETGKLLNMQDSNVRLSIYTDNNNKPGQLLTTSTVTRFNSLTVDVREFQFDLAYNFLGDNVKYWCVIDLSAIASGGSILLDGTHNGIGTTLFYNDDDWNAVEPGSGTGTDVWIRVYAPSPFVLGAFNRDNNSNILQHLPPGNYSRVSGSGYIVDGVWAYTSEQLKSPKQIALYPRAVRAQWDLPNSTIYTWRYVPTAHAIHYVVRLNTVTGVITHSGFLPAGWSEPLLLGNELCFGIAYLAVAEIPNALDTDTDGAPPGDLIVIRSK